jgi:hypothetical protein
VGGTHERQRQSQDNPQENSYCQGGRAHKDQDSPKNEDGQKKAGEEGAGPENVTKESQANSKGRGYAEAGQLASTTRTSHAVA